MFAEDIGGVDPTVDMDKVDNLCCNSFTNSMEREKRVPFM
jgi:hypothetical protein